jgi:uncharacterized protein YgbK (DUF1537 family)
MKTGDNAPFYGWYGDDFTGATDTLATLAQRGVRAFLFLGPPSEDQMAQAGDLDAIGIAGSARAMPPAAMEQELEAVGRFFQATGVRLLHYKCCSTFDSALQIGNIATAMATLRRFVCNRQAVILGGQPSLGRYCVFGNLFAAAGETGIHRLDRHPTMSRHPSTPMTEADLRKHLQALGAGEIGLVPWTDLDAGKPFEIDGVDRLVDALTQDHIATVGRELNCLCGGDSSLLVIGASSVAEAAYHDRTISPPSFSSSNRGPILAVAGSLSPLTRLQVEAATSFIRIGADAGALTADATYREHIAGQVCRALRDDCNVLLSTAPDDPASISAANSTLAATTARLIDRILKEVPVRRIIAAGGDTSSHLVQGLGLWGLSYGGQLSPGVAIVTGHSSDCSRDGITLMLKGGQMGSIDLFERFTSLGADSQGHSFQEKEAAV